ncbi:MAG: IclR family transcriptional regulator [Polaromonas sp.]|nr:IclR family transcriptional regulator [Polaromonas sp.]
MPFEVSTERPGLLQRAFAILRFLATKGIRGGALTEIARHVELPHPTAHRLLHQLISEGMVTQLDNERRYALGSLAFELGLSAAQQFDLRGLCRPILQRLALEAGDTAYLVLRSGFEAVCVDLEEGPSPIRVITLQVGSRRPLGVGAGGMALLAALPSTERENVLDAIQPQLDADWGMSRDFLIASIEEAQRKGYTLIRNRVNAGVSAIGRHFTDTTGRPIASLSVAAINERMTPARVKTLSTLLTQSTQDIGHALRSSKGRWTGVN